MGTCKFCGRAASNDGLKLDFPVCEVHQREVESFLKRKEEMKVEAEDMRVLERFLKENMGMIKCPLCMGGMFIHHWKKKKDGSRLPIFKCRACDFLV
jgi:transposase-like protein